MKPNSKLSLYLKNTTLLLILILLLGTTLRLYHLDQENLWTDEAYSLQIASSSSFDELVLGVAATEGAPLGHYLLLHYWIQLFGTSTFTVRLLSALFGVAAIIVIFYLAKALPAKTSRHASTTALLATLFLATSMLQVLYTQEARLYALYGFLTLLAGYFFVKILYSSNSSNSKSSNSKLWFYYIFFIITMVLAFYTNYMTGPLLLLFILLSLWFKELISWKKWLISLLFIVLLSLPLLPLIITQFMTSINGAATILTAKGVPSFLAQLGPILWLVPVLLLLLVALIPVLLKKKMISYFQKSISFKSLLQHPALPWTSLVIILIALMLYLYLTFNSLNIFGLNLIRRPIIYSYALIRHSYFLVPLIYLLMAKFLTALLFSKIKNVEGKKSIFKRSNISYPKLIAIIILIAILLTNTIALVTYYQQTTKPQWQKASTLIQESYSSADSISGPLSTQKPPLILLDRGGFSSNFLLDFYMSESFDYRKLPLTWSQGKRNKKSIASQELLTTLQHEQHFWLILSRNTDTYYKDLLQKNFVVVSHHTLHQIEVFKYEQSHKLSNDKHSDDSSVLPLHMGAGPYSNLLVEPSNN